MSPPKVSNLAVVLCHGAYHTPQPYAVLLKAVEAQGTEAHCPQLPTSDLANLNDGDINHPDLDRESPAGGYPQGANDARVVVEVLEPLVEAEKNILVMRHSAGGFVAREAALPELQAKVREAKSLTGGIIGIFYTGAFVIPVGKSVTTTFSEAAPPPKDGKPVLSPFMTFHVSSPAEAKKWAATLVRSTGILTANLTNDAYSALPGAYSVLEEDLTLSPDYQRGMVKAVVEASKDPAMKHEAITGAP